MNKKYILSGLLFASLTSVVACGPLDSEKYPWEYHSEDGGKAKKEGDAFEKGATDPKAMASEVLTGMSLVFNPQKHKYQYARANSIDTYAGYWTVSQNKFLFGPPLPTTYTYPNGYLGGAYGEASVLFPTIKNAYFHAEELGVPYIKAVAMLMFDFAVQELADIYGPLPFDDLRNVRRFPPYTYISDKEVYERVFKEIDVAVEMLKTLKPSAEDLAKIEGPGGGLSRGDWRNWVKFANSLRLRMAMNMVKAEPEKAQELAEKSINDEIGVFTDMDAYDFTQDRMFCSWMGNNPLFDIGYGWDDIRMGASIENILKRLGNPLIGEWFIKNPYEIFDAAGNPTGYVANDDYVGIRQGVAMINKKDKKTGYGPFSAPSPKLQNMPLPWIKRTEMLFIMAEGALRGWAMGATAEELYERGVKLTFTENGLSVDDAEAYLETETVKPVDYVDPYNAENNIKGRVNVGVKWNENDSKEVKLEKIITQKYIGVFPCSAPTWTTFRRTGYPRLFPVYLNNWPGVDAELQIRRIPYIETPENREELAVLPSLLGGQSNTAMSRLFWDVETESRGGEGDDKAKTSRVIPKNF